MKNFIRNIVALAAVLTIGTASIPTTNGLPVSLTVSASAASIYSVTDARNDLATVNAHPYYLSYYRKYNTKSVVKAYQRLMRWLGYSLDVDGIYGADSRSVCKKFQRKYYLTVDGCFGDECCQKMSDIINSVIAPDSTESLDFSRAYNYALAYWCDRNYDYNYYEGMNCQNFVSQIFLAAGFPTSSSFKNGTYAFINVDGFLDYMRAKGVAYTSGRPSVSNVKPGDVIVTNNGNHVMFVMDVSGGNIYASGNTNNRDRISVSTGVISGVLHTSSLF